MIAPRFKRLVRLELDDGYTLPISGREFLVRDEARHMAGKLMNLGLIDELGLMVNPVILGGGKALFKDVTER